jgi:hypothetical protein
MRRYTENGVYVIECNDSSEIDNRLWERTNLNNRNHFRDYDASVNRGWSGGTKEEITHAMLHGWPSGQAKIQRLADDMRSHIEPPKSYKRRGRWAEDGDEPSWEREQRGCVDIWRTSRRQIARGPTTVQLLCPWVHASVRRAKEIQWNGVVLSVLCDLLETAGYRVGAALTNSVGTFKAQYNDPKYLLGFVHVKQPQNPLDLASLVPIVAHPGVYRWHGIAMATLGPVDCGGSHGAVVNLKSLPSLSLIDKDAILLTTVYHEADARREIERVLAFFKEGHPHHEQSAFEF